MAQLEVFQKEALIDSRRIDGEMLSIGRKPENLLVFDHLSVSRKHAKLTWDKKRKFWLLENMSMTNPVRLNGRELQKPAIIFDGDRIGVGIYTLVFHDSGMAAALVRTRVDTESTKEEKNEDK